MLRIDLNADVGEMAAADEELLRCVTSASVAAGFHAGTPSVLRATIRFAKQYGVAVGAHPSFADAEGFGRRDVSASPRDVEDLVLYQVAAVAGVAAAEGVRLRHVKAHGALYHMAARDAALAAAIARAVAAIDPALILFGPPRSALLTAARAAGLRAAAEAFADRAYQPDGSLVPRSQPGGVIADPGIVVDRVIRMVTGRTARAIDGSTVAVDAETICVHGDTPGAATLAATLRNALEASGIAVQAIGDR